MGSSSGSLVTVTCFSPLPCCNDAATTEPVSDTGQLSTILMEPPAAGPLDCFHLCVKEDKLKFPENDEEANGYVNQFHVTRWEKKDGSVRRAMVRRAMLNHAPLGTAPSPPITHDRRVASHSSRARVSSMLRRSRW